MAKQRSIDMTTQVKMLEYLSTIPASTVIVLRGEGSWWILTDLATYSALTNNMGYTIVIDGRTLYFIGVGTDTILFHHMRTNEDTGATTFLANHRSYLLDKYQNASILLNIPYTTTGDYLGARLTSMDLSDIWEPSAASSSAEGNSTASFKDKLLKLRSGDYHAASHGFALSEATPKLIKLMQDILRVGKPTIGRCTTLKEDYHPPSSCPRRFASLIPSPSQRLGIKRQTESHYPPPIKWPSSRLMS